MLIENVNRLANILNNNVIQNIFNAVREHPFEILLVI